MVFALTTRLRRACGGVGLALALLAHGAPAGAAEALAQNCARAERGQCLTEKSACERDCSDLTRCVRRCCEAFNECLTSHGCDVRGSACPH